jgi:hypothetical protein
MASIQCNEMETGRSLNVRTLSSCRQVWCCDPVWTEYDPKGGVGEREERETGREEGREGEREKDGTQSTLAR